MHHCEKCCSHCPGNWRSSTREFGEDHCCCVPEYVRGNLKISSLRSMTPGEAARSERLRGKVIPGKHQNDRPTSCYDRFAIAKKFHAENLQHQPLPDRVDDSIFKNVRGAPNLQNLSSPGEKHFSSPNLPRDYRSSRFSRKIHAGLQYGPILGCKTPTTNMDLAICWEAPLDPTYEPSRAVHIDGTDGGPAPAIFTLVEREIPGQEDHSTKCLKNPLESYEAKFSNVRKRCRCRNEKEARGSGLPRRKNEFLENSKDQDGSENCSGDSELSKKVVERNERSDPVDNELCHHLESCHISGEHDDDDSPPPASRRLKPQPLHLRNCSSCQCRGDPNARKPRRRLTQSAHVTTRNVGRNGLPKKNNVPRPKTPYAKRSFCIDTLTPPFSIVHGCRDADYPEHWRLTSVYQQSYRNPMKQRGRI